MSRESDLCGGGERCVRLETLARKFERKKPRRGCSCRQKVLKVMLKV
jgi:hypothetical protein